jgi:hypothetical protein
VSFTAHKFLLYYVGIPTTGSKKYKFMVPFNGTMFKQNFNEIHPVVLELNQADKTDGQTWPYMCSFSADGTKNV